MAITKKKAENERKNKPNLSSRRERTRKEGKCQLCETATPIKDQFTVVNDLEAGEPVKRKNAGKKGNESSSHYCGDCAGKRVKQKQAWLDSRDGTAKPKKGKKAAPKKAAKKGKAKAKKAGVKKVKKVRRKESV